MWLLFRVIRFSSLKVLMIVTTTGLFPKMLPKSGWHIIATRVHPPGAFSIHFTLCFTQIGFTAELILLIWCSAVFRLHAIYTPHSSVRRAHFKVEENSSTQITITMKFVKIITAAFLAANTFIGKFVFYPFISYDVVWFIGCLSMLCI